MSTGQAYVIIGNGIAGITAAEILRAGDPSASITIVADDPYPAYYRPALKDYLGGRLPEEKLWARPAAFYREQRIRFVPGRVVGINPLQRYLQLHDGKRINYSKLLLANGARPRSLTCPGLDLAGVSTLRSVADYQEILRRLGRAHRVVVCGSGTLALESAETLRHRNYQVTHLIRGNSLWSEVLDAVASDMVLQEERRDGIDVRTGEEIKEIVGGQGQVSGVITTSGEYISCELVLIGIGIEPVLDFVRTCDIACGRGVKVDHGMRTSVADIYAAGDVIETTDETGRTRVLGQWFPAIQQAQVAAYNMLGVLPPHHPFYPGSTSELRKAYLNYYNATFLYGLDFVSIGLTTRPTRPASPGYQEIIADPQPRHYRKVILKDGVIAGALLLGERSNALAFKRALDHRVNLSPVVSRLFSADFSLDAWLDQQGVPGAALHLDQEHASAQAARGGQEVTPAPASEEYFQHIEGSAWHGSISHIIPESVLRALDGTPALVLAGKDTPPQVVHLAESRRYTLGRDSQNDIVLHDPSSSRHHAEIFTAPDGFYVRDLNSRYGVFVNRMKITNAYHLSHGDRVVVGNLLIYFSYPGSGSVRQPATSKLVETPPLGVLGDGPGSAPGRPPGGKQPVVVGLAHRQAVQRMEKARVAFEIDMCIGCNRCMDACPVPVSSQVSIADLNSATISGGVAPHVARFTHECIMCGSCVPVCPVDNHRDLLMLSLKERLGVSWNSRPDMSRVTAALPVGWTLGTLIGRLREQAILRDAQQIPDNYLFHLLAASRQHVFMPGDTLLLEGEYGRDLYLILEGYLELTATNSLDAELPVAILRRGEYAGEDGMLTGRPYNASVRAQAPALVLQVPEQVMQRLMELVPGVRAHFERINNARSLTSILKRMALFQGVAGSDIQWLIHQASVKHYDRDERLFAEDNQGRPSRETLHILLEGFVKVARKLPAGSHRQDGHEHIVAYRQGGDYFAGGLDLLGDGHAVTVTTINRCRVAEVPRSALLALFQQYPEVSQRFAVRLQEYIETTVSTQDYVLSTGPFQRYAAGSRHADPLAQGGLHELVSGGVVEGTEVLVIDLDKCIHCNECEEACARRHGYSRMNRKGIVIGNISIATACRQCQDPVCMLCSRAGIARHPNGEVYITESCIGCGICAERCPYGAISIVNIDDEPEARPAWQRFSAFFTKGAGKERARRTLPVVSVGAAGGNYAAPGPLDLSHPRSGYDELRKKVAIKCDLCAGYSDQACVQACPVGAAVRIQPTKFFGSTEEILQSV
jgi:NADPH-dependent 2,4-dienoyl-CoA reductase/sulfur reductase-like enzyme/Fe-S-cluster-containing hydrogenase component 2/CRP-like cAMP-binding protein